ncbi:hypothetical protein ACFL6U_00935 [Planctomycetota bacterium]
MTFVGTLVFVASEDLGKLGSENGESVEFIWPWHYLLPILVPWLILALALTIPRGNRLRKAWPIFIPMAVVAGLWRMFLWIMGEAARSSDSSQFEALIFSMCSAIAVLWLCANTRSHQRGVVRLLIAVGILTAVAVVGIWSYMGCARGEFFIFLAMLMMLSFSYALSMLGARRLCKRVFRPFLFSLVLLPCIILFCIFGMLIVYLVITGLVDGGGIDAQQLVLISLLMGSMMGALLYGISLPFQVLGACNPFYRERFQNYLALTSKPQGQKTGPSDPEEQVSPKAPPG